MGGFMILNMDGKEGHLRLDDTMALDKLTMRPRASPSGMPCNVCPSSSQEQPALRCPIRVFGDSQLMIHFLT